MTRFFFRHILGIIIPIDELIFFRGVETTNQMGKRQIENDERIAVHGTGLNEI